MKEYRVYAWVIDDAYFAYIDSLNLSWEDNGASLIEQWSSTEEPLPSEALEVISMCENNNTVYNLSEFQAVINCDGIDLNDYYIFITNKY